MNQPAKLGLDNSRDLLDVLEYIAYDSTPIERAKRVELVKQRDFDNLILQYYLDNGLKELGADNLKTFINIHYGSTTDAKERLQLYYPEKS